MRAMRSKDGKAHFPHSVAGNANGGTGFGSSTDRRRYMNASVFDRPWLGITVNNHCLSGDHESHDHEFIELTLIASGRGVHRTIHGDRSLQPGEVIFLRPGEWHTYLNCRKLAVTNCCIGTQAVRNELAWVSEHRSIGRLLTGKLERPVIAKLPRDERLDFAQTLTRMAAALRAVDATTDARLLAWLVLLLAQVARALPGLEPGEPVRQHPAVHSVYEIFRTQMQNDIRLADLSAHTGLAPAHLVRVFRSHAGMPPMAYLTRLRLERAAALLLGTGRSVSEIGQSVGIYDPNYFTRCFRAQFGVAPTEYRRRAAI